jgi:hypothetical protein
MITGIAKLINLISAFSSSSGEHEESSMSVLISIYTMSEFLPYWPYSEKIYIYTVCRFLTPSSFI